MKKIHLLFVYLCCTLLFLSGCWDRRELNDRAIWMATGWDVVEKGKVEISGQVVIPANVQTLGGGGGGAEKGFFAISAKGRTISEALRNIQTKLPREAFFGHRRVIFLSEDIAKRGLKKELDIFNRDPETSLRTDVFVVKGAKSKEVLTLANPLEKSPIIAALKEHRQSGGRGDTVYLKFLIAANRDGIRPSIPAIEITNTIDGKKGGSGSHKVLRLAGLSIFDKTLKMRGFLTNEENRDMLWVMGTLSKYTITIKKKGGEASLNLVNIQSKIKPKFDKNNKLSFTVTLIGKGTLTESNTGLDVQHTKILRSLEKDFENQAQKLVQQTIEKVQKEYRIDIFGFGETVHRKNPARWKTLKNNWDQTFSETKIAVKADIKIKRIGMNGPSLFYKGSEIKK